MPLWEDAEHHPEELSTLHAPLTAVGIFSQSVYAAFVPAESGGRRGKASLRPVCENFHFEVSCLKHKCAVPP